MDSPEVVIDRRQTPPWYAQYIVQGLLVGSAFVFTLDGRMGAEQFLAFAVALMYRSGDAPPGRPVNVQGPADVEVK